MGSSTGLIIWLFFLTGGLWIDFTDGNGTLVPMCSSRAKPNVVWLQFTVRCCGILLDFGTVSARENGARLRVTKNKISVTELSIN